MKSRPSHLLLSRRYYLYLCFIKNVCSTFSFVRSSSSSIQPSYCLCNDSSLSQQAQAGSPNEVVAEEGLAAGEVLVVAEVEGVAVEDLEVVEGAAAVVEEDSAAVEEAVEVSVAAEGEVSAAVEAEVDSVEEEDEAVKQELRTRLFTINDTFLYLQNTWLHFFFQTSLLKTSCGISNIANSGET